MKAERATSSVRYFFRGYKPSDVRGGGGWLVATLPKVFLFFFSWTINHQHMKFTIAVRLSFA